MASDTLPPSSDSKGKGGREKIALKQGFHLVDWMRLMQSMPPPVRSGGPRKVSLAELAEHSSQFDCWTAYNGKVYNISQYLPFHPGGASILMQGAGKDCTKLFQKYHAWVNIESMLAKCYVGTLMSDNAGIEEDEEEEDVGKECESKASATVFKAAAVAVSAATATGIEGGGTAAAAAETKEVAEEEEDSESQKIRKALERSSFS